MELTFDHSSISVARYLGPSTTSELLIYKLPNSFQVCRHGKTLYPSINIPLTFALCDGNPHRRATRGLDNGTFSRSGPLYRAPGRAPSPHPFHFPQVSAPSNFESQQSRQGSPQVPNRRLRIDAATFVRTSCQSLPSIVRGANTSDNVGWGSGTKETY